MVSAVSLALNSKFGMNCLTLSDTAQFFLYKSSLKTCVFLLLLAPVNCGNFVSHLSFFLSPRAVLLAHPPTLPPNTCVCVCVGGGGGGGALVCVCARACVCFE